MRANTRAIYTIKKRAKLQLFFDMTKKNRINLTKYMHFAKQR